MNEQELLLRDAEEAAAAFDDGSYTWAAKVMRRLIAEVRRLREENRALLKIGTGSVEALRKIVDGRQ